MTAEGPVLVGHHRQPLRRRDGVADKLRWLEVTEPMAEAGLTECASFLAAISAPEAAGIVSKIYEAMEAERRREFRGTK